MYGETVFFGLQYILKKYFSKPVTKEDVDEAADFCGRHGEPFNKAGWMHIVEEHGGRLPIRIRAVPEGTIVPTGNIMVSVENTDPDAYWLTSVIETMLVRLWYPINVATISRHCKQLILEALEESSDDPLSELQFKLHDFGSRGVSSRESAAIGGAAHLVNFQGSDTVVGVMCANEYYNCDMSGYSIPAAEHSTTTTWGRDKEVESYRNMLTQFAGEGRVLAVVSDSYDIYRACEKLWGEELRQEVVDSGSTVVIRPDSGDPVDVVTQVIEILGEKFGYDVNGKGYRVLRHVRVLQGDGIDPNMIHLILEAVLDLGYSADNIAFGMGGALLQMHNRDTQRFAMKCSLVYADGQWIDVYKEPITDPGKNSKRGRLDLIKEDGQLKTVVIDSDKRSLPNSEMCLIYRNGHIVQEWSMDTIRHRAEI